MKYDDISFKLLALVIIAGVILALTGPTQSSPQLAAVSAPSAVVIPSE
ncbi:MAG: hypothetical protein ABIZ49_08490 [Opitutaceae bacterium]